MTTWETFTVTHILASEHNVLAAEILFRHNTALALGAGFADNAVLTAVVPVESLAIFGAQANPDPAGRGPGIPTIDAPNTSYCTSKCGELGHYYDGYPTTLEYSNIKSIQEVEVVLGEASWETAYLSGDHPWGTLCLSTGFPIPAGGSCTNSWINYRPDDSSVLITDDTGTYFPSI